MFGFVFFGEFECVRRRLVRPLASAELDRMRLNTPSWRVSFNRGLLAESQGNTADAIANYRDAIELREGDYQRAEDRLIGLGGER